MLWDLGALELGFVVLAVIAGALTQGSIGIGFGMIVVPTLTLLAPQALPATPLLISLPLTTLIGLRERRSVDTKRLPALLAGRVIGTVLAVALLLALTEATLEVLFGVVILVVTALSAFGGGYRPTGPAAVVAGTASGVFATTTSIGGPPLALLYQQRPGPEVRSTLSLVFLIGGMISLAGLSIAGRLWLGHLLLALLLSVPMTAGFVLSRRFARFLDGGWLRPAVLAFAASAGALAVVRGILG